MKKINPLSLVRARLKNFTPYKPSKTIEQISSEIGIPVDQIVKLDTGENPYIDLFHNKKILNNISFSGYPDPLSIDLREKLAQYTGFPSDWIMCGSGSDELIDLLIRVFVNPKEEIIICPPTFPMYSFSAQLSDAKVVSVPRIKDFNIDTNAILKKINKNTKIVFIESPGNPSNIVTPQSKFKKILEKNVIVVADEAYFEYANKTALPLVKKYPNLIVLRTLSKWAGLAGLRIGYLVANPEITHVLLATKQPYNINVVAQKIAVAVLDKSEIVLKELQDIIKMRTLLYRELSSFPQLKVYKSEGAYIVFTPKTSAENLQQFLRNNGVMVKLLNEPLLENSIRINLRKEKEIKKLISTIKKYYEQN